MRDFRIGVVPCRLAAALLLSCSAIAQTSTPRPTPRDYHGVQTYVDGIYVTPVANAPFTAKVSIVSHERLADGSEHVVKTSNSVARTNSGRIYNERRALVPASYQLEPRLLSAHIFDPETRISVFLDPSTRLARQQELPRTANAPATTHRVPTVPGTIETDLGAQTLDGVVLQGLRKSRTLGADVSGTGKQIVIVDEYWYSTELSLDMIIRHEDPRTGEQMVAVTEVKRGEPDASLFQIPSKYKVVDETPPPAEPRAQ